MNEKNLMNAKKKYITDKKMIMNLKKTRIRFKYEVMINSIKSQYITNSKNPSKRLSQEYY